MRDKALAERFRGGYCFVFRLGVEDYHRYFYIDDGVKGENVFIPGKLHTVQPAALEKRRVFAENCREYTAIRTAHFGCVVQAEVGAMMVGRIVNRDGAGTCKRGQEKGRFEFGGSTVVLFVGKDRVIPDAELLENTKRGAETGVWCGERLGCRSRLTTGKRRRTRFPTGKIPPVLRKFSGDKFPFGKYLCRDKYFFIFAIDNFVNVCYNKFTKKSEGKTVCS